jgi:hypothetical protein
MNSDLLFVNRRKGGDRRLDTDPCKNLPLDLYHRKRRKSKERRASRRSLSEDYFAYQASVQVWDLEAPESMKN